MTSAVVSARSLQRAPSSLPAETPARRPAPPSRALTRRWLLAAIAPDPTALAALGAAAADRLDWDWLLERAQAHKVAALLAARAVEQAWAVSLPAGVRRILDEIRGEAQRRAAGARRTLQDVGRTLTAREIPFVVLKGSVLAEQAYKDPSRRPFYDVDLLVPPERLDDAEAALVALGYRYWVPPVKTLTFVPASVRPLGAPDAQVPERVARALYRTYHYHFVYVPPAGDDLLPVELHWHVATPGTLRADPSTLWAHTTPTVVAETEAQTLDLETTLVYVAWHAIKDGAARFRLLHLCDVAWLLARFGHAYQPDRVWALADAWHMRHHLARALDAVRHLWAVSGVPRPASGGTVDRLLHLCFRVAGDPWLIGAPRSRGGLRTLAGDLLSETLWELALARLPRRAARRLRAAGRVRLPRLRATPSSVEP